MLVLFHEGVNRSPAKRSHKRPCAGTQRHSAQARRVVALVKHRRRSELAGIRSVSGRGDRPRGLPRRKSSTRAPASGFFRRFLQERRRRRTLPTVAHNRPIGGLILFIPLFILLFIPL